MYFFARISVFEISINISMPITYMAYIIDTWLFVIYFLKRNLYRVQMSVENGKS